VLDGLRPDTCVVVVDNIRWDQYGNNAEAFDFIEYGCDGDRRILLRKQRIESQRGQIGVSREQLVYIEQDANARLRGRQGCTCR
jgi:hypothetical protein